MKTNNAISCPACGSKKIERHEVISKDSVTLGSEFIYQEVYYHCDDCSDEFDILNESEKNFRDAEQKAHKLFATQAIEHLVSMGISMALFERVFELPTRTLTRWKEGNLSAGALSLLRVLITYPWVVKVAEKKYDTKFANYELVYAATSTLVRHAANLQHGVSIEIEHKFSSTTFFKINTDATNEMIPRATVYKEVSGAR